MPPERVEKYNESFKDRIKETDSNLILVNHEKSIHHFYCDNGFDHTFEISGSLLSSRRKHKHTVCTICNDVDNKIVEVNLYNDGGYKLYDCGNQFYVLKNNPNL